MMDDYQQVLRRAGLVLVGASLLGISVAVYCTLHKIPHIPCLAAIALTGGFFLLMGGLKSARIMVWYMGFVMAGTVARLVLSPVIYPFDLISTYAKHYLTDAIVGFLLPVLILTSAVWIYRQLVSDVVMEAREAKGLKPRKGLSGFIVGGLLYVAMIGGLYFMQHSASGRTIISEAADQYGAGYHYILTGLNQTNGMVNWNLIAYNDHEVRTVCVQEHGTVK